MEKEEMCMPPFPAMEDLPVDVEKRTVELIQVFQRIHKIDFSAQLGISKGEFVTLTILAEFHKEHPEEEGVYVSYIAKKQGVANSQISRMLKGLEEEGLIGRKVAKEDRRNTYVFLTSHGNQVLEEVKRKMEQHYCRVMERYGEKNMEELIRLFNELVNIMEEEI